MEEIKEIRLYHFFSWSDSYGWQHPGKSDGYETYEECYKDNEFYTKPYKNLPCKFKIMKLEDVERGE